MSVTWTPRKSDCWKHERGLGSRRGQERVKGRQQGVIDLKIKRSKVEQAAFSGRQEAKKALFSRKCTSSAWQAHNFCQT